jgi:hypothetical protein
VPAREVRRGEPQTQDETPLQLACQADRSTHIAIGINAWRVGVITSLLTR